MIEGRSILYIFLVQKSTASVRIEKILLLYNGHALGALQWVELRMVTLFLATGNIAIIAKILFLWSMDHRTGSSDVISYKMAKLVIFEVITSKWSRDPSFWSIFNAYYGDNIFITKTIIAKLWVFEIFLKWSHSDRKWSKVVSYMTEWPNDTFWPLFRQKAYSEGILKSQKIQKIKYLFKLISVWRIRWYNTFYQYWLWLHSIFYLCQLPLPYGLWWA